MTQECDVLLISGMKIACILYYVLINALFKLPFTMSNQYLSDVAKNIATNDPQ